MLLLIVAGFVFVGASMWFVRTARADAAPGVSCEDSFHSI
jgi:hypothetical protein